MQAAENLHGRRNLRYGKNEALRVGRPLFPFSAETLLPTFCNRKFTENSSREKIAMLSKSAKIPRKKLFSVSRALKKTIRMLHYILPWPHFPIAVRCSGTHGLAACVPKRQFF